MRGGERLFNKLRLTALTVLASLITVTSAYAINGFGGYGGNCPYGSTFQKNSQQTVNDTLRQQDRQRLRTFKQEQLRIHMPQDAQNLGNQTRKRGGFQNFSR